MEVKISTYKEGAVYENAGFHKSMEEEKRFIYLLGVTAKKFDY